MTGLKRIIGLDPGLRRTGWGVIASDGTRLSFVAAGVIAPPPSGPLAGRLATLYERLNAVVGEHRPDVAAVEDTFVNKNPASTLKLGQARAISLLAPALAGLAVHEYAPNLIKKAVVGAGHAQKKQIQLMVGVLLPGWSAAVGGTAGGRADAADALAVAITHAHIGDGRSGAAA